jgi:hypothetical protein
MIIQLYLPLYIDILRNKKLLKLKAAYNKKQLFLIRTPLLKNCGLSYKKICRGESVKIAMKLSK